MSAKKSILNKARGAGRRAIVEAVVMVAAATIMIMNSVSTSRDILPRHLYIFSSERLSKVTVTVIKKTIRAMLTASTRRLSSAQNWRPICLTPGRIWPKHENKRLRLDPSWTGSPSALGRLRRQACVFKISLRDHPGGGIILQLLQQQTAW